MTKFNDETGSPMPPMTATEETVEPTKTAYEGSNTAGPKSDNLFGDAKRHASDMARDGMQHPDTKPVLKGAAIGAVAGIVLPFVGPFIGAAAGAGYVFYNRIKP